MYLLQCAPITIHIRCIGHRSCLMETFKSTRGVVVVEIRTSDNVFGEHPLVGRAVVGEIAVEHEQAVAVERSRSLLHALARSRARRMRTERAMPPPDAAVILSMCAMAALWSASVRLSICESSASMRPPQVQAMSANIIVRKTNAYLFIRAKIMQIESNTK